MKAKDYKYERLSESDACLALLTGIIRLKPKGKVYHAANYVLTYEQDLHSNKPIVLVLEDKKQSFKCTGTFTFESTTVTVSKAPNNGPPNFAKAKSGLRQMLAAIVLHDYAQVTYQRCANHETE